MSEWADRGDRGFGPDRRCRAIRPDSAALAARPSGRPSRRLHQQSLSTFPSSTTSRHRPRHGVGVWDRGPAVMMGVPSRSCTRGREACCRLVHRRRERRIRRADRRALGDRRWRPCGGRLRSRRQRRWPPPSLWRRAARPRGSTPTGSRCGSGPGRPRRLRGRRTRPRRPATSRTTRSRAVQRRGWPSMAGPRSVRHRDRHGGPVAGVPRGPPRLGGVRPAAGSAGAAVTPFGIGLSCGASRR